MARICCISFESIAHVDFGGMSFLKSILELKKTHSIKWIISRDPFDRVGKNGLQKKLEREGLEVVDVGNLYLSSNSFKENRYLESFNWLYNYFEEECFDCIVIDRLCTIAAFAACKARIPWIGVGTCGGPWGLKRTIFLDRLFLAPIKDRARSYSELERLARECDKIENVPRTDSHWVCSPYLNISYFPRSFYDLNEPDSCQFYGVEKKSNGNNGKYILFTFGNSMSGQRQKELIDYLSNNAMELDREIVLLTGKNDSYHYAMDKLQSVPWCKVYEWLDYDKAFSKALIAIGHGGTAFVWYSIAYSVPMVCLPEESDHFYNALRVTKLGLGKGLYRYGYLKKLVPLPFKYFVNFNDKNLTRIIKKLSQRKISFSPYHTSGTITKCAEQLNEFIMNYKKKGLSE